MPPLPCVCVCVLKGVSRVAWLEGRFGVSVVVDKQVIEMKGEGWDRPLSCTGPIEVVNDDDDDNDDDYVIVDFT